LFQRLQISLESGLLIGIFIVLLCFPSTDVRGQCAQKLAELPPATELLGFRLGMTKDEVKKNVPQTRFGRIDDFGVSKTTINPHFDTSIDATKFVGVRSVSLDFLDDRLTSLWIGFDETYKVHAMDDFARVISQSLQLPQAWSPWRSRGKQMRCADFQVRLQTVARGPSVRILDVLADDTIAARRQAKEERDAAMETAAENGNSETKEVTGDRKTKTYYPNGCEAAKEVTGENRVVFNSVEDAEKAGFKVAKRCN
jgi:Metal binding domain of Ada